MSFRWVILGAGAIAEKFADAIRRIDDAEVIGVGSRSKERGRAFADKNGIPHAGSYQEMLALRPDAAYIAATTEAHADLTRLCIEYGIPVLCEKAMFTSSGEAEEVFAMAKEKKVFAMEAMWSRFLPTIVEMKRRFDEGAIGQVKFAEISIGWDAPDGPGSRFYEPGLGGGAAYDLLVYCYELAEFFLGIPEKVENVAVHWADTGVDESETVTLRYPWGLASLSASIGARLDERTVLLGEEGQLRMSRPHYGSDFTLRRADGTEETWRDENTPNGFVYEAMEVMRCVHDGLLESPTVPHDLTIRCAKVFDLLNASREG
ncbi:MAG: Gfo/Idh/MocA family oxidoreductase [Clostridia bacterium]|nr:Gfo/Idh/MocA family oxidoreductase [Clostridia bacterium]